MIFVSTPQRAWEGRLERPGVAFPRHRVCGGACFEARSPIDSEDPTMLNLSGPVGEDFFKAFEKMRSEAF